MSDRSYDTVRGWTALIVGLLHCGPPHRTLRELAVDNKIEPVTGGTISVAVKMLRQ